MKNRPVPDLPYQALLIMEPYWVQQKAAIPDPRFNSTQLSEYSIGCMENGGVVTVNMGIYQDGTAGEKALEVMRQVKIKVKKNERSEYLKFNIIQKSFISKYPYYYLSYIINAYYI